MENMDMILEPAMENAAEEIATNGGRSFGGKVVGVGLTAIVSVVAYEFVVKPVAKNVIAKIRAKKTDDDSFVDILKEVENDTVEEI